MADVYLKMTYDVQLSDKEMRIICLSLAGKLKTNDDKAEALALNLRLLDAQKIRLSEKLIVIDGAIKRATDGATKWATEPQAEDSP